MAYVKEDEAHATFHFYAFVTQSPDNVGEGIVFRLSIRCLFVWTHILLAQYLMDGLSSLNKTYREIH